jgi:hypothetical protein
MGVLAMDEIPTKGHNPARMAEAERIVKPQWPTAVQVENLGIPFNGSAMVADDVDHWSFIFTEIDGDSVITLDYANGEFGKAHREARPWKETAIKELPRGMSLEAAIVFLRKAGYLGPFQSVALKSPQNFDDKASYVFTLGRDLVYINSATGKVTKTVIAGTTPGQPH